MRYSINGKLVIILDHSHVVQRRRGGGFFESKKKMTENGLVLTCRQQEHEQEYTIANSSTTLELVNGVLFVAC